METSTNKEVMKPASSETGSDQEAMEPVSYETISTQEAMMVAVSSENEDLDATVKSEQDDDPPPFVDVLIKLDINILLLKILNTHDWSIDKP